MPDWGILLPPTEEEALVFISLAEGGGGEAAFDGDVTGILEYDNTEVRSGRAILLPLVCENGRNSWV